MDFFVWMDDLHHQMGGDPLELDCVLPAVRLGLDVVHQPVRSGSAKDFKKTNRSPETTSIICVNLREGGVHLEALIRKALKEAARRCRFPDGKNALACLEQWNGRERGFQDERKQ
ncbi:MAG: hypothetical protein FWC27_00265 [Firmicutes bacterium]|nr:hypothetical protein [Bacillota bacterium]